VVTLIRPFSPGLWLGTALSVLGIGFLFITLNHFSFKKHKKFQIVASTVSVLLNEGLPDHWFFFEPKRAIMAIFFVWLPISSVLTFAYKGTLLASLVKSDFEKPIETFEV
jgi:hypothetical protein